MVLKRNKILVVVGVLGALALTVNLLAAQNQGPAAEMEQIYKAVDKDQDGKLSKEEYFAIWKDKTKAEKNFRWYDKDGDGYITKEEFFAPLRQIEKEMGKRK